MPVILPVQKNLFFRKVIACIIAHVHRIRDCRSVAVLVGIFSVAFVVGRMGAVGSLADVNFNWWIWCAIDSSLNASVLVALGLLLPRCVSRWLLTVLAVWSLLAVTASLVARVNFGIPLEGEAAQVLLASSWQEMKDFLIAYTTPCWVAGLLGFVVLLALIAWLAGRCVQCGPRKWPAWLFAVLLVPGLAWCMVFPCWAPEGSGMWRQMASVTFLRHKPFAILSDVCESLMTYRDLAAVARDPELPPTISFAGSMTNEILGVVIVGESSTRNRWSLYGYGRDTTPCVRKWASELYVFKDVVSVAENTTKALRYVFSDMDVDTGSRAHYFLPAACHRGGYEGVLLSNQGHWGEFDGLDAVIFRDCVRKRWLQDEGKGACAYDEELLPMVRDEVCGRFARKALFVHLQGSHHDAKDRYPSAFACFGKDEGGEFRPTMSDHYDNSIRYTDSLIAKILEMVKARDCASFVICFSDHGESPGSNSWRYVPDPDIWEIPMFVWVSEKYARQHPELTEALRKAVNKPLVSDQLLHGFERLFLLDGLPDHAECGDFLSDGFKPRSRRYNPVVGKRKGR